MRSSRRYRHRYPAVDCSFACAARASCNASWRSPPCLAVVSEVVAIASWTLESNHPADHAHTNPPARTSTTAAVPMRKYRVRMRTSEWMVAATIPACLTVVIANREEDHEPRRAAGRLGPVDALRRE